MASSSSEGFFGSDELMHHASTDGICNTSSIDKNAESSNGMGHPESASANITELKAVPSSCDFGSLPLSASLQGVLSFVKSQNFVRMTPVQAATVPRLLKQDVVVQACTGSGKTLSFLIPIVERVILQRNQKGAKSSMKTKKNQIHSLVLSPTRELAQQTFSVAKSLCIACGDCTSSTGTALPAPLLLTGGGGTGSSSSKSIRPVTSDLKTFDEEGNDILIGTPGRVSDFLSYDRSVVDCTELEYLILDEADVLFQNSALSQTLSNVLHHLPKQKRIGLFSATTSNASLQEWIARVGMRNPVWIDVAVVNSGGSKQAQRGDVSAKRQEQQRTPTSLKNYYLSTRQDEKLSRLVAFLQDHSNEKIIVFFLTCACVEFFGGAMQQLFCRGVDGTSDKESTLPNIELLHGKLVQKRREKALERFHSQKLGSVLACTDVAARGLDVADVDWVVQFDAPQDPAVFVHRVGRTARAGRSGRSLLFLTPKEEAYIELLRMRQVPIVPLPTEERCCPLEPSQELGASKSSRRNLLSSIGGEPLSDVLPLLKGLVLKDRDMLEKGTKAFTSYIRAYKEHRCAFIFRFQSLDLGLLATSFALLRLPKMPELRDRILQLQQSKSKGKGKKNGRDAARECGVRWHLPHFEPAGPEVSISSIPFLDPHRESARQRRLEHDDKAEAVGDGTAAARPERRGNGRLGKDRSVGAAQHQQDNAVMRSDRSDNKKRGRNARLVDEWEDLAKEERLYKKLRKKKITQDQYDAELYGDGGKRKSK